MRLREDETSVAVLNVHGGSEDPIAARLRATALLGNLELRARVLPREAILCVRQLRDPLPYTVSLESRALRPPAQWQEAVQRELDRVASTASWPARAAVSPGAEAVAFADPAELLACLAGDLAGQRMSARWWWPLLLAPGPDPARTVARTFVEFARFVPAAMERLAARRELGALSRALPEPELRAVSAAVGRAFAVRALVALCEPPAAEVRTPVRPAGPARPAPWAAIAPEADDPALSFEQQAFAGVVLSIARAQEVARGAGFAAAVLAFRLDRAREALPPEPAAPPPPEPPAPPAAAVSGALPAAKRAATPEARPAPQSQQAAPPAAQPGSMPEPAAQSPLLELTPASPPPDAPVPRAESAAGPATHLETPLEPPHSPRTPQRPAAPAVRRRADLGPGFSTALGGLFYLLNVALYLGLYGDDENLPLSPWRFIARTGELLLGGRDADPVWAALDGFAGDPAPFDPAPGWLPPSAWTEPFGIALPAADALPSDPVERWFALVVGVLRPRLRLALGLAPDEDPAPLLLRHAATVHAGEATLDVVLSLESLPVAVRLAGLDRDPGWLAAAGRTIAFHFE